MDPYDIAERLQREWQRRSRRASPLTRWSLNRPLLASENLTELERRLADGRGNDGRAVLRCLVELAQGGDHDAALLVTASIVSTLPSAKRNQDGSRRSRGPDYDSLAGGVWIAVTAPHYSTRMRHLREEIIRRAWRIVWHGIAPATEFVGLNADARYNRSAVGAAPEPGQVAVASAMLSAEFDRLQRDGQVSSRGRQILEQIAVDAPPPASDSARARGTYRQQQRRAVIPLRDDATLLAALSA